MGRTPRTHSASPGPRIRVRFKADFITSPHRPFSAPQSHSQSGSSVSLEFSSARLPGLKIWEPSLVLKTHIPSWVAPLIIKLLDYAKCLLSSTDFKRCVCVCVCAFVDIVVFTDPTAHYPIMNVTPLLILRTRSRSIPAGLSRTFLWA